MGHKLADIDFCLVWEIVTLTAEVLEVLELGDLLLGSPGKHEFLLGRIGLFLDVSFAEQ